MFNIDDFLVKFRKITIPDNEIRIYISEVIFDILKLKIEKYNIKISNNSIFIKTDNIIKTEIFLNKNRILNKINNKFINRKINNIL